ncbi:MAG TPA: ABC-F family ATP-binding cassette domain-containing protein [Candidatus Sumerlaeota bacterium]|nr:ABC-F family ATP-binding cassette domain-containing protein [Candidatus Sumerlaeota bacterium]HOR29528.1 ABC-F family ATP-binding cassette domain-containing protein [Candidatus Sumerlaeota bacterium]
MLTVNNLSKFIGARPLLEHINFMLQPGECATLVGANGSGKSTLLRICAGEISPDAGEFTVPRDATIGYLPQHAELHSNRRLRDELRHVFEEVLSHQQEADDLAHKLGELDPASDDYMRALDRFGHLHHEIERLGAYDMDSRIGRIAAGLGFRTADLDRPCQEFSGGWRMRILLARLLLRNPDVLLLDEPTNHLDLETMIWLEDWIRSSDSTVLMVSHERAFMDNLAQRVLELHEGQLTIYRGNYTSYLAQREERWQQWSRAYANQQEEIARIQKFIDRFRYKATKAVQVQSRIKQLEKIERIPPPPSEPAAIHFKFPPPDRGSKEVFVGRHLSMAFGPHQVLRDIDFSIWRGDRVAIVGLNGAGKTTLMKLMTGALKPTAGEVIPGPSTTTEYFAQYDDEGLSPANTVFNEVNAVAPAGAEQQVRNLLGGFFFSGEDADKKIAVLSGGERTRVRLAKMLFSGANTLLLDEPTNHLDLASRRTLEDAMLAFPGTLIFVSHDRVFLERVPTRIFEIKDGRLRIFDGNYHDYARVLTAMGEESPLVERGAARGAPAPPPRLRPTATGKSAPAPAAADEDDASLNREERKARQREERRLRRALEELEDRIAKIEQRLTEIDHELMRPSVYSNPQAAARFGAEQRQLRAEHESLMARWEKQSEELAALGPIP